MVNDADEDVLGTLICPSVYMGLGANVKRPNVMVERKRGQGKRKKENYFLKDNNCILSFCRFEM